MAVACEHGWHSETDCDTCTARRVAPVVMDRVAELEAALRIITHRDRFTGNVVNSYIEDADLREYAPILDTIHPAIRTIGADMAEITNVISLPTLQPAQGGDPNVAGCSVSTDELLASPGFPEPGAGIAGIDDAEAFFNMRDWLQKACEAKGARKTGGGIGCGQADIDIELEGHHYNISIRPLRR